MSAAEKDIRIIPSAIEYSDSYNEALNEVAREGQYLSVTKGYEKSETRAFLADCIAKGYPSYFVLDENDKVVGWCDIVLRSEYEDKVTGSIGIGLLKDYRDAGVGRLLMHTVMKAGERYGFERIILDVRKTNERALHVYELLGFEYDHSRDSTMKIDDETVEIIRMQKEIPQREEAEEETVKMGCAGWLPIIFGGCLIGAVVAVLCILL